MQKSKTGISMSSLGIIKAVELLKDFNTLFVIDNSLIDFSKLVIDIGDFGITKSNVLMNWPIDVEDYLHGAPEILKSFFIFSFCY